MTGTLVEPCSSQFIESQTNSEKKDLQKCPRTSKEARRNERARMNYSKDGRTVGTKQKVGVLCIASSTASYKYSKGGGHKESIWIDTREDAKNTRHGGMLPGENHELRG
jgi:hypothetical protein